MRRAIGEGVVSGKLGGLAFFVARCDSYSK
jgi:hypothetical protein